MTKKITSIILALCMIVSCFAIAGISVSAAEGDTWTVAGVTELVGAFWDPTFEDNDMVLNADNGLYEITYEAIPAGTYQFKVCKNHAWDESYGSAADNYALVLNQEADVTIQFNEDTHEITVVSDPEGAIGDFTISVDTLSAVGNGEPEGGWLNDIEWNPAENVMTEVETGIYEISFYDVQDYDNWQLKFAANGSWDSNWGMPKGDDVSKAMPTDGEWFDLTYNGDNGIVAVSDVTDEIKVTVDMTGLDTTTGAGVKAKIELINYTWTVAGVTELVGAFWDPTFTDNDMVLNADNGLYEITYEDIPAGSYQFKVCKNHAWAESYGSAADNYALVLTKEADVTIQFDATEKVITVVTDPADALDVFVIDVQSLSAVGNGEPEGGWLNDIEWNPAENVMTEVSTGIYEITFTDVQDYDNWQLKFAANGSWDSNWGMPKGDDVSKAMPTDGTWFDLTYNGDNGIVAVDEPTDVKITVDMTGLDTSTGAGVKAKIEFIGEPEYTIDTDVKFNEISITHGEALRLNFYAAKSVIDTLTDPFVVFTREDSEGVEKRTVALADAQYNSTKKAYKFTFAGINAQRVGDTITATIYGVKDGAYVCSKDRNYSIMKYLYARYPLATKDTEKTVIVDLLNFASAAQIAKNYKTDALCNADVTEEMAAYGTQTVPTYHNILNNIKIDKADRKVTFKEISGTIGDAAALKYTFTTDEDINDITLKFTIDGRSADIEYGAEAFTETTYAGAAAYTITFKDATFLEYSKKVTVAAYKDGVQVSNAYEFDVESYVSSIIGSATGAVKDVYNAMMMYANSIAAYAAK